MTGPSLEGPSVILSLECLVCRYIHIYLAVYGPENQGGFSLDEKQVVCGLGRTNFGGLWNVQCPIIDPLSSSLLDSVQEGRMILNFDCKFMTSNCNILSKFANVACKEHD